MLNVITNSSTATRDILLYCITSQTRCFIWNFFQVNEWMIERMNTWNGWMNGWLDGHRIEITYLFLVVQQPCFALGSLLVHVSRSHSETQLSVGLLWTSDRSDAEFSTWQNTALPKDRHPCTWRDPNPQSQQASGRRPCCQRFLLRVLTPIKNVNW